MTGSSGTGKTTYWLEYLHKCEHALKLVFDAEGEFVQRGKHGILCHDVETLNRSCEEVFAGESKSNIVLFDPSVRYPGNTEFAFDWFCDWAFQMAQQTENVPKVLATDELQNCIGTDIIPESFRKVLETGRRYSLDFAGITQALNLIHNRVRNQITELVAFRTTEERALSYMKSKGCECDEISELPDLHFHAYDLRAGDMFRGKLRPWKTQAKIDAGRMNEDWQLFG